MAEARMEYKQILDILLNIRGKVDTIEKEVHLQNKQHVDSIRKINERQDCIERKLEEIKMPGVCSNANRSLHPTEHCQSKTETLNRSPPMPTKGKSSSEHMSAWGKDNFINQVRAEIHQLGGNKEIKTGLTKSASFNDPSTKPLKKPVRNVVSDPLPKDAKEKYEQFQRECLSKAIQWNMCGIIESCKAHKKITLPEWIKPDDARRINYNNRRKKNNLRKFLCLLVEQDFDIMQNWLCTYEELSQDIQENVWRTFGEFFYLDPIKTKLCCLRCRLVANTCVTNAADQLKSADILSDELYNQVIDTDKKAGCQENLWAQVIQECLEYGRMQNVICVFKVVFSELVTNTQGREKMEYQAILEDIDRYDGTVDDVLYCQCHELCLKSLHPLSCVKTYSAVAMYMPPPATRKHKQYEHQTHTTERPKEQLSTIEDISGSFASRYPQGGTGQLRKDPLDSTTTSESSISSQSSESNASINCPGSGECSTEDDRVRNKPITAVTRSSVQEHKHTVQRQTAVTRSSVQEHKHIVQRQRSRSSKKRQNLEEKRQKEATVSIENIEDNKPNANKVTFPATCWTDLKGRKSVQITTNNFYQKIENKPHHIRASNVFVKSVIQKHGQDSDDNDEFTV
ncbi:uncharacterized protein LOC128238278 [Mya arenaria]|uniref:uncharacterized protein LOC128238278 n=1 Tax=Mya arenaria TaxID=6604 RepID=UPI0022DF5992|nr:uncharacterized protein LOC128238278 [Mya arenaria]